MVNTIKAKGVSQRRACWLMGIDRTSVRYQRRAEDPVNVLIRAELHQLAKKRRRYGSPRITDLLRRKGYEINHKRVERLWREEALVLPRKRKRRRRGQSKFERRMEANGPNEVWSYDFVFDRTQYGQKLKMLVVLDEYTRECLEIRVEKRMTSKEVIETLDELMAERGAPTYTRSDNGPRSLPRS